MSRLLLVAFVGLSLASRTLAAQTLSGGERIRVRHAGESARVGTLVALTNDTLVVRWANDSAASRLPVAQVSRLEVSRGTERRILPRTGRGFIFGAAAGAVIGFAGGAMEDCEHELICFGPAGGALAGATVLGVTGAVIGALTGLAPSERWESARPNPGRVALLLPARGRGKAIGLAVAF